MTPSLFELREQFMIILTKLSQVEKIASMGKIFVSLKSEN